MNRIKYTVQDDVLASKGLRLLNFVIDYITVYLLSMAIGVVIGVVSELTGSYALYEFMVLEEHFFATYLIGICIWLLYYTPIETLTKGRTLGKYITKTKVVLYDGSQPTFHEVLVRSLCRLIPFEAFSFLGETGKGWHDSLSKTYVVNIEKFEAKKAAMESLEEIGKNTF
ncbi:MAG: RDD family protein [Psychroserpens sp.]|uniref:RDD family protein n=1 Tax=Psychroserpens sp. TaxID=2020870 RepID=UPI003C785FC6